MSFAANLAAIQTRIAAACARCGRDPATVRLLAVSKTVAVPGVAEAVAAGQQLFGENYVQEFVAKAAQLPPTLEWHFIGALQSNKVKYLAGKVALIHSVDRLTLAREIDRQWGKLGLCADILLEVNLGDEGSKAGSGAAEVLALATAVARLPHLRLRGLMALPPFLDDPAAVRPYFRRLRELALELSRALPGIELPELSMGMSHDFEVAIEEGATLIRVGTALFGARPPKPPG
ncbi:MAG: YggS family pyridoxal phosphate enzyme [Desulfuromonadales bacterium GWD2_61_12]|nr:MAG: YggS family pyridoxal phosphate enzyme [Desulfuromonadales bacterium GWC2_61_20]OGR35616.1 MAG: YggS family pyridoxal phosphate enzyme [Desulfuromonadales bacterium GWD2_61_12]HAD04398.1 YggS family pyridoxal phosphate-dependent enzyme [Desulfuromonas sp.]